MTTVGRPGHGRQIGHIPTDGQNRQPTRVVDVDAHEGPVYVPGEDALYFASVPRPGRISPRAVVKRLALDGDRFPLEADRVDVLDTDLVMPNGMAAGLDGSLIVCEQGSPDTAALLRRLDPVSGRTTAIVDSWHGTRLNSPNDVVAKSDGTIWFTDPAYGYLQGFRPEPQVGDFVYRFDPTSGSLSVVADSFSKPNGIAFSSDETVLYVTDSGANQEPGTYYVNLPHHVIAFDVVDGRHLANQRLFAVITPGFPDGIKVDDAGWVYVSSASGVQVLSPDGDLLHQITVPGTVNFTFGGADRNILFITADTAVWAAALDTRGSVTAMVRTRRILDTQGVDAVIAAAERAALAGGYRVVMVVVDASGRLLALRRTEGSQAASDQVAIDKARTAAIFVRPSRDIEKQVTNGRLGALALHGARALTGGVPLTVDGEVVGAIGTSGETPDEDESVSIAGAQTSFSTVEVPALTYEDARRAAEAVAAVATQRGVAPVAAVVDSGGDLIYLWRPDRAQVASVGVATDKARTAAIFRRPSKDFEDQASGGRPSALHLAGAVPLQGGMPIVVDGHVVGAIGVSGASSADEDQELAVIGQQASDAVQRDAVFIARETVDARFEMGGLLLDTSRYKLDAGRRTGPGDVELHDSVVDIMHVVSGNAKVVTGDSAHELRDGDVLVIPNGVPHQFVDASDPFLYFVTKVEV